MTIKHTEQRARQVAKSLLKIRGWNLENLSGQGQCLEENEYKNVKYLQKIFKGKSKTGKGDGYPDFLLLNSNVGKKPILILETKATSNKINEAIADAIHYGEACIEYGHKTLVVGVAGGDKEICEVCVKKYVKDKWVDLTLDGNPIDWIPSPKQTIKLLSSKDQTEVQAEKPNSKVLAEQAERLNEILRECNIKDEYRPVYIATFMLGLWQGDVSVDSLVVLNQINSNAKQALISAEKTQLQNSLHIDSENDILSSRAWEIIEILKKVNIRSFIREHDYLGQLYETFFRYTGGNTIGQYFTPRHIINMICDILNMSTFDKVLDPACGTGGFLIGALNNMVKKASKPYEEAIKVVNNNLFGIESEPATAVLCITNMILRGDGKSGVIKDNCFTNLSYPNDEVDFVLMNPPFPHKKTDTPVTDFIDRGLKSLKKRGVLATIIPYSLLVRINEWHKKILKNNSIYFIATLPSDVFQPYASYNTAILMIQKGIPHENKNVFMAKVFNDGYKIKKKNRIEIKENQIPEILKSFVFKKEVPELTSFPIINNSSEEWTPENYIKNKKHSDIDFVKGLENHIRKHTSFYIANGNKIIGENKVSIPNMSINVNIFSANTTIDINKKELGEFLVSDFFNIKLGGKYEIEDLEDGDLPVVSTSEFMNGVTAWKKSNIKYGAPSITVATDGSVCSSFVQEFSYYAFYKIAILTPKEEYKNIDIDSLYYVSYMLFREKWRYLYARKFGKTRIGKTVITLPIKDNKPDFNRMGQIVRQTRTFSIINFFRDSINSIIQI